MGRVEGAVEEAGLGVLGRHLQTGGVHPGAGGKDDVRMVVGHLFQHLLGIHLGVDVLPAADEELVGERLHQRSTALVLSAHPRAGLGIVLVEEDHPQFAGPGAEDVQLAQQRLRAALRLQQQLHGVGFGKDLHLIPEPGQILPHLRGGGLAGVGIAVHRQIHQQRISRRQPQRAAAQRIELLAEHGVEGREIQPVVLRPRLTRGLAGQRLQSRIAAQPGEADVVDAGELIEIEELIVELVFQRVVSGRDEPGDGAGDLDGLIILEDRDPLVTLLYIEPVHVLEGNDGGMDALFQMGFTEVRPLDGKLGVVLEEGHEVGGKGGMASGGLGAHDALGRDVHQPQRLLRHDVCVGNDLVQHREIGRLAPGHAGPVGTLACTQGAAVIFHHR